MGKTVIITGASGLIGQHLVKELADTWDIHAVSRKKHERNEANISWHCIDLEQDFDNGSLPKRVDAIVYLAQSDYFRDFPDKAINIFSVNTFQVLKALDFARRTGVKSFIYASSGGVYGFPEKSVEESITIPASGNIGFYLSSKLCSEMLAENYAPYMNIVLLRFFFVYGKGQKRSMLIPRLVDSIRDGKLISLQGNDGLHINPVHVSDAVRAISRALKLRGCHRLNVAGPDAFSLRELCEIIGRKLNIKPAFEVNPSAESGNLIGDIKKMQSLFVDPVVHFEDGIQELL